MIVLSIGCHVPDCKFPMVVSTHLFASSGHFDNQLQKLTDRACREEHHGDGFIWDTYNHMTTFADDIASDRVHIMTDRDDWFLENTTDYYGRARMDQTANFGHE